MNLEKFKPIDNPEIFHACRHNSIVYIRNYKVASSYYYYNFINVMGWQPILPTEIDWDNEIVFSHITDPIARRHKGISMFLFLNNLVEDYFDNTVIQEYIGSLPYIDNHSASIYQMLGDNTNKVNWLLADYTDPAVAYKTTANFMEYHNLSKMTKFVAQYRHAANDVLKKLYSHVETMFLHDDRSDVYNYFNKDILLYNKIKKG